MYKKRLLSVFLLIIILSTNFLIPVEAKSKTSLNIFEDERDIVDKKIQKTQNQLKKMGSFFNDNKDKKLKLNQEKHEKLFKTADRLIENQLEENKDKDYSKYKEYRTLLVDKNGEISTIREAFEIANTDIFIKEIVIKEGDYEESDLTLFTNNKIKIRGEGKVNINGNMVLGNRDNKTKYILENLNFNGQNITSDINDLPVAILSGFGSLELKDINIKNYFSPLIYNSEDSLSSLNIIDSKITNNIGPISIYNSVTTIDNLTYENNNGELQFISGIDKTNNEVRAKYSIKNSLFQDNEISSYYNQGFESLIFSESTNGQIENTKILDNSLLKETEEDIYSIIGVFTKNRGVFSRLDIKAVDIKDNNIEGADKFDSIFNTDGVDLYIQEVDIDRNNIKFNRMLNTNLKLQDIGKNSTVKDNSLQIYIENQFYDTEELLTCNIENIKIKNTNKDNRNLSFMAIGMDLNIENVEMSNHNEANENFFIVSNSILNINNIKNFTSGDMVIKIDNFQKIIDQRNNIRNIDLNISDSPVSKNNLFLTRIENGFYDFSNIKINKDNYNYKNAILVDSLISSYKDIDLKNTGVFYNNIEKLNKSGKNDDKYFIENFNLINDNKDKTSIIFPVVKINGNKVDELKIKNMSITDYSSDLGYLQIEDVKQADIYQLKTLGSKIGVPIFPYNIEQLNIYNSTLLKNGNNKVQELLPYSTKINVYNSIFQTGDLSDLDMKNTIVEFKNSILSNELDKINPNFIVDNSNIIGNPELDSVGYPKKNSIVIDKGKNNYAKDINKDLAGKDRINNKIVDIGAYEYYSEEIPPVDPPVDPPIDPPVDPPTTKEAYHEAYIEGYNDNTIRPNNFMTRHEAAIILYRLMDDKIIEENYQEKAIFKDIPSNYWGQKYIGTLTNIGVIKGYENGEFKPKQEINRAEFAKMIHFFNKANNKEKVSLEFNDTQGHWAEKYIYSAVENGWMNGYVGGSFKPNNKIKRSEVIVTVNRVFNRDTDLENMLKNIKKFKDLNKNSWYYRHILEATNSHDYIIKNGEEVWTKIK